MIRLRYFASLRETLGTDGEDFPLDRPFSIAALRNQLAERGGRWGASFAPDQRLLAAVNQDLAHPDRVVHPGDEVAFFPPVTGG